MADHGFNVRRKLIRYIILLKAMQEALNLVM